jgi:hypothetical protein
MLGKRNRRAGAFSICHATVLAGFIVLAQVLGLGTADHKVHLSDSQSGHPSVPAQVCLPQGGGADAVGSCAVLMKATHKGATAIGIVVWSHGTRL